ncbi:MAG: hypothetical protein CVU06_10895 [Bacteroidetes bacterium HGW-Bacteroidetes-22]|nr:MAG: hypothetical protein CVU06_10895 [Bacteroidetes bacterium HGW-Bacteroidetes-22]
MEITNNGAIVNSAQCHLLGQRLSVVTFRPEFLKRPFLVSPISEELRSRMFFFSVAICHQTYALQNREMNLFGWDYLEDGFLRMAQTKPHFLDPSFLVELPADQLADELALFFSSEGSVASSTLDRRSERAFLMKESARFVHQYYNNSVKDFLISTGNCLKNSPESFYEQLRHVLPFADPLYKKSTFLLKLLIDARLYQINDPENIIPVMDYHMQRVLLRTGCVEIVDNELFGNLSSRRGLADDSSVREASVEAMKVVARASGLNPLLLNDVFYMLGRSCCLEEPLCVSHQCSKQPCSLTLTLHLESHNKCLFTSVCRGEIDSAYRRLWHPMVVTHYY